MSKNRWKPALAWLLLGVLFPGAAVASKTVVAPDSPYVVEVWGIEDGLPGSSVLSVAQTRDGYLWLGTLYGLVRFDGVKFTIVDEENTHGLNSSILHLFEDSRSNLWVGAENGNVALIKRNGEVRSFDIGRGIRGSGLISACEDADGGVWMLFGNGPVRQLCRYQNEKLEFIPGGCKAIAAEKSGVVWLGTDEALHALAKVPPGSPVLPIVQKIPLARRLDFLLASLQGGYWRLADGRIEKWHGNDRQRDFGPYPWGNTPVMVACEDGEGNLIVGTYGDGVYWFDAQGKYIRLSSELSHSSILSLTMDREGNLWVGTNGGGLNRVKRKRFGLLANTVGKVVQSVCADGQGGLWIGYNGDRIEHVKDGTVRVFHLFEDSQDSQNSYVKSVFMDGRQQVWAGIWFNFAFRLFQFKDDKFQPVSGALAIQEDISVLFQDRKGSLWVGTQAGLVRWDGQAVKRFTTDDKLPANDVRAIADDADGNLWIGTGGGLARLRDGEVTPFRKQDGLPSDDISALYVDADGVLWVGTRGNGLARFHQDRWTHYTTRQGGLTGNSIGYLIEDGEGNLWLGSIGLMRAQKKSLNAFADGTAGSVICRAYVEADGLPTRECTQGSQPAACRTADGRLWFPTARGLVYADPGTLKPNSYHAPVVIESVRLEDEEQNTSRLRNEPLKTVVIRPGKERLEIHYTSLSLGAAERSRFQYRLVGHESDWIEANDARVAHYTKLPPRDYEFHVRACNDDGEWNPTPATLAVIVQPPFWRQWWFLSGAGAFLIGLIVATVYFLSTQKLQRELASMKQQEALEQERSRIARDLHDQLGANLTQVALLGEMAGSDKNLPEEVESHAQQISQTARETTRALDEIVWAVNPSNDTLEGLVTYACNYAQEYLALAGVRYRMKVPPQLPEAILPPDVRHNVFLAFKEAINNVVKHARASETCIRLRLEPAEFTLEIEDDGTGPGKPEEKSGRNGLRNMRKRMEDIRGAFSIGPAEGQGTVVKLTVPIVKLSKP